MKKTIQKFYDGFTLVELMVGSLITLVTVSALMLGVSNVRYTLQSLQLREKAVEKLTAYTNHWKAYIYKAEFSVKKPPVIGDKFPKNVSLFKFSFWCWNPNNSALCP